MYLGRYQIGQVITLAVQCQNGSGTPTAPDDPPVVKVRSNSGLVQQLSVPVSDRYHATGLFALPLRLTSSYSVGRHTATFVYHTAGGYHGLEVDCFEVVAGGDTEGAILTQYYLERPEAQYLVQQTEAGSTLLRRGPSV